ncbi:MAG: hypothetical protein BroJett013_30550 [Alphaproteobacteria bacterium]|nr:MAG: hypothetical protein BroJett013_30550 [Alphaproteobacteria bacterium]
MIRARPYCAGDLALIEVQPEQTIEARLALDGGADAAAQCGVAYTIVRAGVPVACGGLMPLWRGVATAWGFATPLDGRLGVAIRTQVRAAIGALEAAAGGLRRIEATARADFAAAQRFLVALGFEREALLRAYGPDGGDYWLYAWLGARS